MVGSPITRRLAPALVLTTALLASGAAAQSPPSAEADRLFRQARALLAQGRIADACTTFAKSHALEPALGSLLNHADCLERLGKRAGAYRDFAEAQRWAERTNDPRRGTLARERAEALRPKLAVLVVEVEPSDATLEVRDAVTDEPLPASDGRYLVDPGPLLVAASAPGHTRVERKLTLPTAGETTRLVLQLDALPVAPPPAPVVAPLVASPASPPTNDPPPTPEPKPVRGVAVASIITGSVLVVGGAVGIIWCQDVLNRLARQQPGGPDEANPTVTRSMWDTSKWLYPVAIASAALGATSVVLGAVFLRAPATLTVVPTPAGALVQLSLRWE